jgi:type II secretion system protein H
MKSVRHGFTLVEMLAVLVLMGIVLALAAPRIGDESVKLSVRSASQKVGAFLTRARAEAMQNGRRTAVVRVNNGIRLVMDNGTATPTILGWQDLGLEQHVTLDASPSDSIVFDPRGLAILRGTAVQRIVVTRDEYADTACVIGRGRIATSACSVNP